jgi:hypothetical protein
MLSLFTLFIAMTMLGFWGLAWWLLKQPVTCASIEPRPPQSEWRNEPTLGQGPVPSARKHENSDSNTQFFNRTDVPRRAKLEEETELLDDQTPSTERTAFLTNSFPKDSQAPRSTPRRKTTPWFSGPKTSPRD